jgi:transcriptional regulator with XRE-family HTH domain
MLSFGDTILLWRLSRSLSQAELADLSGLPRPNLSDIEKGKQDVTLSTIRSLATALKVSPGTLVNGAPPLPAEPADELTRASMERIARAASGGTPPENSTEQHTANLLRDVLRCRIQTLHTRKRHLSLPGRKANRSWILLRALYPAEVLSSLITKSVEHAEMLWTSDK